jgi:hypothetical protein
VSIRWLRDFEQTTPALRLPLLTKEGNEDEPHPHLHHQRRTKRPPNGDLQVPDGICEHHYLPSDQ